MDGFCTWFTSATEISNVKFQRTNKSSLGHQECQNNQEHCPVCPEDSLKHHLALQLVTDSLQNAKPQGSDTSGATI